MGDCMPNLRPYLEYLENYEELENMAQEILDLELGLDKLKERKNVLEEDLKISSALKRNDSTPEKIQEKEKLLTGKIRSLNKEIFQKELDLQRCINDRQEAIRRGMSELFHKNSQEYELAKLDWIKYSELSLKAHERMKKKKKELDAIKSVFKAEFSK